MTSSNSLSRILPFFEQNTNIKVTTEQDSSGSYLIVLNIPSDTFTKDDLEFQDQTLRENTQMKLIDDFFTQKVLVSPNKDLNDLKALYASYVSASRLNKKFGIKQGLTLDLSSTKDEKEREYNILDMFSGYLEEKGEKIVNVSRALDSKKTGSITSLKGVYEEVKKAKERKQQLQADVVNESIKGENYVKTINEKVNRVVEGLDVLSRFKEESQLKNDGIEVIYQQRLLENLKLHREVIEKKILSDLYTEGQIAALRVVKDGIEKKVNLLLSNRNYVEERLKEVEKRSDDLEFTDVLAKIHEVNKSVKRKEEQLRRLKELRSKIE